MIIAKCFNSMKGSNNYNSRCDFNNDGAINMTDIMQLAVYFNKKVK
jgi:hypothetical protein